MVFLAAAFLVDLLEVLEAITFSISRLISSIAFFLLSVVGAVGVVAGVVVFEVVGAVSL